ncbi:MAG: sugar phosphorylase [Balneolaceae bacterium]|nr:sugar phosphorylase [Balneolaceae bacterium]MCH8549619.1 sugar phosphorylase [Balneolaceae bacterium]
MKQPPEKIRNKLTSHFRTIYGEEKVEDCLNRTAELIETYQLKPAEKISFKDVWTHQDQILITYGDMVQPAQGEPVSRLSKQHRFLKRKVKGLINTIHILPFFPSTSDDGFSVVDYKRVDSRLGGWEDIEAMSEDFRLMGDLVMNHVSRYSDWFQKYLKQEEPYKDYFIEVDPSTDLSGVTRPRSSPIITPVHTEEGEKFVWCTFSDDQVDVNFANLDVLFEYLDIFLFYLSEGITVIRLDAVAFIWKEIGTNCIHLKETHEIVKLFRTIVDHYAPETTIITETNVPHKENISYFGDGDETHMVYQFSLPPLLLHAILTENSEYLTRWTASLNDLPENCTYFNFTASHDGIGVRPLEGLVPQEEFDSLVSGIRKKGGFVSEKQNPDGTLSPYELNITYFDAFGSPNGKQSLQEKMFICSQIIMMSLQGVPGIYFHNLTATRNNLRGVSTTGRYRTINRKKWYYDELMEELSDPDTNTSRIFSRMKQLITKRWHHPAFHPFGGQKVYEMGSSHYCIERWDPEKTERVLVIANLTNEKRTSPVGEELPLDADKAYDDIISGKTVIRNGQIELGAYQVAWIKI